MNEIAIIENLYLLTGEIPKERKYSTGGSLVAYLIMNDEEEYVRSCFYQKGNLGENNISLGSLDNNDSNPHYYFSYDKSEEQKIKESFISMQEFLASATYINRRFDMKEESKSDALGGIIPDTNEQTQAKEECFLICALGNKALIKKDTFFTSGYEVISTSRTPLNSSNYEFTSDVEETNITPQEIIEGIKSDLSGEIKNTETPQLP